MRQRLVISWHGPPAGTCRILSHAARKLLTAPAAIVRCVTQCFGYTWKRVKDARTCVCTHVRADDLDGLRVIWERLTSWSRLPRSFQPIADRPRLLQILGSSSLTAPRAGRAWIRGRDGAPAVLAIIHLTSAQDYTLSCKRLQRAVAWADAGIRHSSSSSAPSA
jgi:hypothetical protein